MPVSEPIRSGILGKLANMLPRVNGRGLFNPIGTSLNFTNKCPANCSICLENANKKSYKSYTIEETVDILRQIDALNLGKAKRSLHLWGGEPFLERELLFGIIQEADKLGFKEIDIATNGYWGKNFAEARKTLSDLCEKVKTAQLALEISCDYIHQSQDILNPASPANIIFLAKKEFPKIQISINSLFLDSFQSLRDMASAISAINPGKTKAFFDDAEYLGFYYSQTTECQVSDSFKEIPLGILPVSLSGRYDSRLSSHFGCTTIQPQEIASLDRLIKQHISIGIDRQMYLNLFMSSPEILPMGSIHEFTLGELIERAEMDPIAISLMRHGYSELYPHLSKLFDFDTWIKQFYADYDILQGLEVDTPCLKSKAQVI